MKETCLCNVPADTRLSAPRPRPTGIVRALYASYCFPGAVLLLSDGIAEPGLPETTFLRHPYRSKGRQNKRGRSVTFNGS